MATVEDPRRDLITTLEQLSLRSHAFAKYGFTPAFSAEELIEVLRSIGPQNRSIVESVLEPFINSTTARLDALEDLQRLTSTLVDNLNAFYGTKTVAFDVTEGFVIKGPTGKVLKPEWLSSGEQQLLLLLCHTLVARHKQTILMVDEPELSLNVKWQRKLIDGLLDIASGANTQFIFATYSIEMISQHLDNILKLEPALSVGDPVGAQEDQ